MFPIPFNFPFRKKDGSISTIGDEITNGGGGGSSYTLPTASAEVKGGVKVGSGLTIDGETLKNNNPTPYTLPTASAEVMGGVKVGSGLSIDENGVLSSSGGGGSATKVYYKDFAISAKTCTEIVASKLYYTTIDISHENGYSDFRVDGYKPISIAPIDLLTGYFYMVSPILWNSDNYKTKDDPQAIYILTNRSSFSASSLKLRVYYVKSEDFDAISNS